MLLSIYYVVDNVVMTFYALIHLILIIALWQRYYDYPHFIDEKRKFKEAK